MKSNIINCHYQCGYQDSYATLAVLLMPRSDVKKAIEIGEVIIRYLQITLKLFMRFIVIFYYTRYMMDIIKRCLHPSKTKFKVPPW